MKPIIFSTPMVQAILDGRKTQTRRVIKPQPAIMANKEPLEGYSDIMIKAAGDFSTPKYRPGDVLYVGETWVSLIGFDYKQAYWYRADIENPTANYKTQWKSPVTMPREAARLFLKVTDVRAERLNQITNNDILREGLRSESCNICVHDGGSGCEHCFSILNPFRKLWDSLNAKRGYGWDTNPWVWVYTFERITKEGAAE